MKSFLLWFVLCCATNLLALDYSSNLQMIENKNVDQVQIEEVIHMLDRILEELPGFIEKYELNSNLSWVEWKKKYWLLAPVGTVILGVKVYFVLASVFKSSQPNGACQNSNDWR